MKRFVDITLSLFGLLILWPFLLIIAVLILFDSKGGVFFKQTRVGNNNVDFLLYKFRTMVIGAEQKGQITVGDKDNRITRTGYFLRKYKLDELPQLLNVLKGDMSIVGPRPEVRKYVDMYTIEQKKVLQVLPGLTDYASIEYANENMLLAGVGDWEKVYVEQIMPDKLRLNLKYIEEKSLMTDLKIIFKTIAKII